MKKILVIDDLPENVFMLQDRLENEGYEVITAYEGKSGISKAINEHPDLILLDIMMYVKHLFQTTLLQIYL